MRALLRRMGNSSGVIISKPVLAQLGVTAGDSFDLTVEDGHLILVPAQAHPRTGWREAARQVAEAGDDAPAWPEFGNEGDADLRW